MLVLALLSPGRMTDTFKVMLTCELCVLLLLPPIRKLWKWQNTTPMEEARLKFLASVPTKSERLQETATNDPNHNGVCAGVLHRSAVQADSVLYREGRAV